MLCLVILKSNKWNCEMIYTIYACLVSFPPIDRTLVVGLLCYNGMLGQMLRCLDFNIFMFLFILKSNKWNCEMIYTIYACLVSFPPIDRTLVLGLLCYNGMLEQMLRCLDFNIFMFLFILKSNKWNCEMIYTINACLVSFPPPPRHVSYHFPP